MKKKGLGSPAYELGIHIKKYREQKNWSQDDLASKIETDQKRISKIETGNVYIGWDTFYKISQVLDVSMEELIEGDTDVYEYSGKYSNQVAWERFTEYMVFYDEVVDYNNELAPAPALYDVYYAYDPATEEEAALCVDDVIQIAEENGAEIQIW